MSVFTGRSCSILFSLTSNAKCVGRCALLLTNAEILLVFREKSMGINKPLHPHPRFPGTYQTCRSNHSAQGNKFWLDHFQTRPAFLHNLNYFWLMFWLLLTSFLFVDKTVNACHHKVVILFSSEKQWGQLLINEMNTHFWRKTFIITQNQTWKHNSHSDLNIVYWKQKWKNKLFV